jgi:cbb3-type cytochrome c oxidase subunit I
MKTTVENVNSRLVKAFLYSSILWFILSIIVGFIVSLKLIYPDFLGTIPCLTYGRLRFVHTNGVVFGWLTTAFFGILMYMVPRLTNRPLYSERLGWISFWVWNIGFAIGVIFLLKGYVQGLEYAELPLIADLFVFATFILILINVFLTILNSVEKQLYVSLWYIIAALAWTPLNYFVGNVFPAYIVPGTAGAALSGLYIHNVLGLLHTPLGVGMVYFLLPLMLKKPIYSHSLSLIGFWSLAFFYPLGGSHHYLFSPIPWWAQIIAVPLSVMMIVVVLTVVYNFFATMKGSWNMVAENIPLRFLTIGIIYYMITCIQGPLQSLFSIQKVIHFSDWVVGHAHIALLGTFTFWVIAAIYYVLPRMSNRPVYSQNLAEWHFWLTLAGTLVYTSSLTAAGLVQGYLWLSGTIFMDVVKSSKPFWAIRSFGGALVIIGQIVFVYNLIKNALFKEQGIGNRQ